MGGLQEGCHPEQARPLRSLPTRSLDLINIRLCLHPKKQVQILCYLSASLSLLLSLMKMVRLCWVALAILH